MTGDYRRSARQKCNKSYRSLHRQMILITLNAFLEISCFLIPIIIFLTFILRGSE